MEPQPTDFYKEKDVLGLEKPDHNTCIVPHIFKMAFGLAVIFNGNF